MRSSKAVEIEEKTCQGKDMAFTRSWIRLIKAMNKSNQFKQSTQMCVYDPDFKE